MFRLRAILLQAFVVDLAFGIFVLVFASRIQRWLGIGIRSEPLFIRIVGGFLIFVAFLYYLAYLHHEKQPILIQATLALRFIFILLLCGEILILLRGVPLSIIHVSLFAPLLGEIYFAVLQTYHLKKLGQPLIPLGG